MKLTSILRYSYYNILKHRTQSKGKFIPLYKSRVFNGTDLSQNLTKNQSSQRYKQFLPFILLSTVDFYKPKVLVTQLQFNPQTQVLKVLSLRNRGIITQQFNINNIIPITYGDMRQYTKNPQPDLPTFIDQTMTYFNKFNHDTYIFEYDGQWNQEGVNHPKLSLQERINEKQWFDRRPAY